jgi:iron(III) transport system substrate-binding protein
VLKAKALLLAFVSPAVIGVAPPSPDPPAGYPSSYRQLIGAAEREATLIIYSSTDKGEAAGLLAAFARRYPRIRVDYRELSSQRMFDTFVTQVRDKQPTADLLWSAAMDLQTKLVNDGYAQAYASPEKPNLPPWAIWKNQAWGTTAEPIVIAYNRKLVPAADVPRTHADLTRLLRAKRSFYRGRVGTYDPARSSAGYLFISQDMQVSRDTLPLIAAMGQANVALYATSEEMLGPLAAGRLLISYNMLGAYALERQSHNPSIGVVMPSDYTLVMTRIALIPKEARHPNAAKLFLDFLLSRLGQAELSRRFMTPVRGDVPTRPGARAPASVARAIRISPALIANVDQLKRRRFVHQWNAALGARVK